MSYPQIENMTAAENSQIPSSKEKEIQSTIVNQMAAELKIRPEQIDITEPFDRYGLDSLAAVHIMSSLEERLGVELSPTLPYEYPTVQSLAGYLSGADDTQD